MISLFISNSYETSNFLSHGHPFSGYAHAHTFEEEHNVHDAPYGYELGDDVQNFHWLICVYSHLSLKVNWTTLS